jgi:hypothetical protein
MENRYTISPAQLATRHKQSSASKELEKVTKGADKNTGGICLSLSLTFHDISE